MSKLSVLFRRINIRATLLVLINVVLPLTFAYRPASTVKPWSRFPTRSIIQNCASCHSYGRSLPADFSFTNTSHPSSVRESYDFIIVGGGTAGLVLARRLAEDGKYSVLVLEYGGLPSANLDIPALFDQYLNEENRKTYMTVAQTNGAGLFNNGIFNYLAGRMLGGTSSLNGMFWNRGSPYNYDEWARITGDSSWEYSNLLKYFRKIEDYKGDFPSSVEHGTGGPITVTRPKYTPGREQWFEAGRYLGYPIADPNGPQQISFAPIEFSKRFGRRVSSYTGYLRSFLQSRQQHQLSVMMNADVKRIIFLRNKAVGVFYRKRDGGRETLFVRANKEVIVSAGVINSPVILMRSGIGPRDFLQSVNIPIMKSLPVGENIHDHLAIRLNWILGNRSATLISERDLTPANFQLYNETGDGPYAGLPGTPVQGFAASSLSPQRDWSDMQVHLLHTTSAAAWLANGSQGQQFEVGPSEVLRLCSVLLNVPKSRGYLTLNRTSPEEGDPVINFNFLSHPDDMQVLKEGIKLALTILEKTPVYWRMGARYPPNPLPACTHLEFRSDPYWECFITNMARNANHGAGSCRMGKENGDPKAVVNSQLKVLGFQNLRVVDASVMPQVTNANTQAAVYVIAEKAAEMILNSWS